MWSTSLSNAKGVGGGHKTFPPFRKGSAISFTGLAGVGTQSVSDLRFSHFVVPPFLN